MLVQDLCRRELKVFLRDVNPPLSERIHAGLGTDPLQLSSAAPIHLLGNLGKIDSSCQVHLPAVYPQNIRASLDARWWEFNLPVYPAGPQQCRIQNVETIRRHNDLNVLRRFKAVKL